VPLRVQQVGPPATCCTRQTGNVCRGTPSTRAAERLSHHLARRTVSSPSSASRRRALTFPGHRPRRFRSPPLWPRPFVRQRRCRHMLFHLLVPGTPHPTEIHACEPSAASLRLTSRPHRSPKGDHMASTSAQQRPIPDTPGRNSSRHARSSRLRTGARLPPGTMARWLPALVLPPSKVAGQTVMVRGEAYTQLGWPA
jgi:hypothetical protein